MVDPQITAAILRPGNNQFHRLEVFYDQVVATTRIRLTRIRGKTWANCGVKSVISQIKQPARGQYHK